MHHSPKSVIGQVQATVTVAIFQTRCHTDTLKIVLKSVQWLFQLFFADFVTVMVFLVKWRFRNFHGAARHHDLVQLPLARMTKRRMSQIVSKCNSLGQVFVQAQCLRNRTCNLRNLQRVGQPVSAVIIAPDQIDLRFSIQSTERITVHNTVTITHKIATIRSSLSFSVFVESACQLNWRTQEIFIHAVASFLISSSRSFDND